MKIVINARFLTQVLSGVQRYGIECSRQIKKIYPEAIFICPKNILHHDVARELAAVTIGRNTGHLWEQIDLPFYLSHHNSPPLLNLANTAPLTYRNNFITIHDLAFHIHPEWNSKLFSTWYNTIMPKLARRAKHIFTVSETVKQELQEIYNIPSNAISITYNGISEHMLSEVPCTQEEKEKIILSVGSFNKRKNHHTLIQAFLESPLSNEYKLVIIGDRNKVFSESGLSLDKLTNKNIEIHHSFTDDALIAMYRKAEMAVSLSLYEGFGIPILEGLFFGCRIICSDIPVYRELYHNHASFCDPVNVQSVIAALNTSATFGKLLTNQNSAIFKKYNYSRSARIIIDRISAA